MMMSSLRNPAKIAFAALFASIAPAAVHAQGAATPFSQLAGNWHGSGQVRLTDGHSERLSCRGSYKQRSAADLVLTIRCQSDNNKIDMTSSVSDDGGRLSGHWQERNFGLEGDVDGAVNATKMSLRISGQLQASMTIMLSGASHTVNISSGGPGFKNVSISFSRG